MKQLSRNFRLATLLATCLMSAAHPSTAGGAATTAKLEGKTPEQEAEEKAHAKAKADAEKAKAAAEKKAAADKAKAEKAEAKKIADAEKAKAKEEADKQKAEAKAKAEEEKRLAAEQKAKDREAKANAKVKVQLVSQRGVTQPKEGSKTREVWNIADRLSAEKKAPVAISELMPVAQAAGLNDATIRTQYARWKAFHGVYGTVAAAKSASPAEAAPVKQAAA